MASPSSRSSSASSRRSYSSSSRHSSSRSVSPASSPPAAPAVAASPIVEEDPSILDDLPDYGAHQVLSQAMTDAMLEGGHNGRSGSIATSDRTLVGKVKRLAARPTTGATADGRPQPPPPSPSEQRDRLLDLAVRQVVWGDGGIFKGSLITQCVLMEHWGLATQLLGDDAVEPGPSQDHLFNILLPVFDSLLALRRGPWIRRLLRLYPSIAGAQPEATNGEPLLHRSLRMKRPDVATVRFILELAPKSAKAITLTHGRTALHELALHCTGQVEGNACLQLLVKCGCDVWHKDAGGQSAVASCVDGKLREAIGHLVRGAEHVRKRALTSDDRTALNASVQEGGGATKLPPLVIPVASPPAAASATPQKHARGGAASPGGEDEGAEDGAAASGVPQKLDQEQVDALVTRLTQTALQKKKRWLDAEWSRIEQADAARRKQLSPTDAAESVDRLYQREMDARGEKMEALRSKYIPAPSDEDLEKSRKPMADIQESVSRLFAGRGGGGGSKSGEEERSRLVKKYVQDLSTRQLEKEEQQAHVKRLYDDQREKTMRIQTKLAEQYLTRAPSPATGIGRKLSKDEQKALGDRLATKK